MTNNDNSLEENSFITSYQAVNQHWTHAEQERWSILYNFLMASTILLLAWSAIYASENSWKWIALISFSFVGFLTSIMWLMIGARVNKFIKRYGELGEKIEEKLKLYEYGPFYCGQKIRADENVSKKSESIFEFLSFSISSSFFVLAVPILFVLVYIVLFILSFL